MTRTRKFLIALSIAVGMAGAGAWAKPEPAASTVTLAPTQDQSQAAIWAARFLTRWHFKRVALDDSMSSEILDHYVEALDGERLFFLAGDLNEFGAYRTKLDDDIYEGDLSPPFVIFSRYRDRVAERTVYARGLLEKGFQFDVKETLQTERSKAAWAKTSDELNDLWRRRVKNDWLRLKLAGKEATAIRETLDKRYRNFETRLKELNGEDVFQTFLNAYASAIEPHTNYLAPRSAENFNMTMRLSLEGIGAVLSRDDEYTTIRQIVKGGPADKTGKVKLGDRIVAVGQGASGPLTDVIGWRVDDVVDLIRGDKGTTVRLEILPADAGADARASTIAIVRDKVKLEDQAAKKRVLDVPNGTGTLKIGVIDLPTFYHDFEGQRRGDADYRSSTRDVARLIEDLKKERVDGIVVDLRDNGGGSLSEATQLAGLFIDQGPVVQVKDAQGSISIEEDRDRGVAWDGPLAVMVNRGSASASEIFAAAMQDYGRALIIGENTFGKGTVQNLVDLDQMARNEKPRYGQLKMTIAQFYRVSGGSTQHKGVAPDLKFPATWDPKDFGESALDNALPWTSVPPAKYQSRGDLSTLIPMLEGRHDQRVAKDREYQWYIEDLQSYRKTRETKELSLLESDRRAERDEMEKRKAARDAARKAAGEAVAEAPTHDPKPDNGLDPNEQPIVADNRDDEATGRPDVLTIEATKVLGDAITLLRGNSELAQRVKSFTLVAEARRVN